MDLYKYAAAGIAYTALYSAFSRNARVNPTLATGDVQRSIDGGAWTNLTTLPDLTPAASDLVRIQLSAAELTGKITTIRFKDQTSPPEWDEQRIQVATYGHPSAFDPSKNDVIRSAVAQAGATSSITLDASAVATDNYYVTHIVQILAGTGTGQSRVIIYYVGSSKIAYVHRPWATNPDNTSVYLLTQTAGIGSRHAGGLAQAGATSTITLISTESAITDVYKGLGIKISGGTGIGQIRSIVTYNGSTKVATVDRAWITNPDNTSLYELITIDAIGSQSILHEGTAQAGANGSITLSSTAVNSNNYYDGNIVHIVAGTGVGQAKVISGYTGSSRIATVTENWAVNPDNTSVYSIRGLGDVEVGINNDKTGYSLAADQAVNVTKVDGIALATHAAGMVPSDERDILGTAISTPATAGVLDVNVKNIANVVVNTALAQVGVNVVSQANIDFGALQKASLNAATPASIVGAVGSVTNDVGITQAGADKVWGTTVRTITAFSTSLAVSVWDVLLANISTSLSIGKKLKDWVLGTDSKVLLSTDSQAGVTIPTVTAITNRVTANTDQVNGSASAASLLSVSANSMIIGTVDNTAFTATTTELEASDITSAETNLYKDRWIIFTSGTLIREAKPITAYSLISGRGHFTYQALSSAPANAVTFIIV
jgi:hypothetical protein